MDFHQYLRLFRKWSWLLVLAAVVGGGIAYFVRSNQADTYQAETKVLIGSYLDASNPNAADLRTGAELAKTYAELALTREVLQGTIDILGLDISVGRLRNAIVPSIIPETSILVLTVTYDDAETAAAIANTVAEQLIINSPTNLTEDQEEQVNIAREQISQLNSQIATFTEDLNAISAQLSDADTDSEILRLRTQYDLTVNQITQARAAIAETQSAITALQQRTNSLEVVESAIVPGGPMDKGVLRIAMLGALVGLILASALVLFMNYQENSIKSAQEASNLLDLPVLGVITQFGKSHDSYRERLIAYRAPTSPVAETYHTLQANLLFSTNGDTRRTGTYVITSPGQAEGKSITAANMGVTMAMSGLRVLLIDADLRQPRQHEIFGLENKGNLPELLMTSPAEVDLEPVGSNGAREFPVSLRETIQASEHPNLWVITSGPQTRLPLEVLSSDYLLEWVRAFHSQLGFDVVLFDTPPCLVVADSSVLAATTHAHVVLVLQAGQTSRTAARKARDQFMLIGSRIQGIVLNKANPRDQDLGYGYGYYPMTRIPATPTEVR